MGRVNHVLGMKIKLIMFVLYFRISSEGGFASNSNEGYPYLTTLGQK